MNVQETTPSNPALTLHQQRAFEAVCYEHRNIFLTGPGGSGKSYLLSYIVDYFDRCQKKVGITAMTGCAAQTLHPKARTLHSYMGIGLGQDAEDKLIQKIKKNPTIFKRWLTLDLLIIDEVSMLTPALLEKLNAIAQRLRKNKVPFGGLQVLFVGDFYQIPPVYTSTEKPIHTFAFESPCWNTIIQETIQLTQIKRQEDPVFQQLLNEARVGQLSAASYEHLLTRKTDSWKKEKIKPTLIFNKRDAVNEINIQKLSKLKEPAYTYEAKTVYGSEPILGQPTATKPLPIFLHTNNAEIEFATAKIDRDSPYDPSLTLKIGAQVMCLKNITETPLVNGSRGVVIGFGKEPTFYPIVEYKNGYKMEMTPQQWESDIIPGLYRRQIPLCLSFAITCHKAQSSTLDCALIDIGLNTFEYGQAYVALSRVKSLDGLYIYDIEPSSIKAHPKVKAFYESLPPI